MTGGLGRPGKFLLGLREDYTEFLSSENPRDQTREEMENIIDNYHTVGTDNDARTMEEWEGAANKLGLSFYRTVKKKSVEPGMIIR